MDPAHVFAFVHFIFVYKLLFWSERPVSVGTWIATVSLSLCATMAFFSLEQVLETGTVHVNVRGLLFKLLSQSKRALMDGWLFLNQDSDSV